ncbi:MAG: nitroreductase family protein [Spirochaetae bacterium HGW-Spirochaetae-5]|nr:MAG: nitroreductase family protein [Spirochaetae bacterium HGW-Spirochaetae-5]
MTLLDEIRSRRSVRKYREEPVSDQLISEILEAGRWAPSGLNNQPWRFVVIKDKTFKTKLSEMTHYSGIVAGSDFCIAVFYNSPAGYHREKDIMSIGACIQNMLLYAHHLGIGSVWLGEILKNKDRISEILGINQSNEFMALIAFGYPDEEAAGERLKMNDLLLKIL